MKQHRMYLKSKGFTIVEVLVSLVLLFLCMSAILGISSFISSLAVSQRTEESMESIAVTIVEDYKHQLETSSSLSTEKQTSIVDLGNLSCHVITTAYKLKYEGAYKLSIIITSDTDISIAREVILYA